MHYREPETSKEYVSLTNRRDLSALEVAEFYRRRQIGLFCKWLKQNLRIKAFLDNSENAVFTQIYVALNLLVALLLQVPFCPQYQSAKIHPAIDRVSLFPS